MTPLHMGALHPYEQALTLILAFGPFVLLGVVVWWRRRADGPVGPDGAVSEAGSEVAEGASRTATGGGQD